MERIVAAIIVILIGCVLELYNAWLFMDLWQWFVVPLGLPSLTIWGAYGLMLVLSWPLVNLQKMTSSDENITEIVSNSIGNMVGFAAVHTVMFFIGKIVAHNFM
jgi:hypothetical protein